METRVLLDVAGWIGMISLLSAYGLVSTTECAGPR